MGTNATIVISDRHDGREPTVLAGLYAPFDGGVLHTGGALARALDKVVCVPGDFLRDVRRDGRDLTPEQEAEVLEWRAGYGRGLPTLVIARLFNEVDVVTPGATYDMGDGPRTGIAWRYSHNAFLLQTPDRIDLGNSIYRYFVEPRPYDRPWVLAGQRLRLPRPWLKAMYGGDTVIFEGWPEDATVAFEAWEQRRVG